MGFSYTPPKNAVAKSATAGKRSAEADPAAAEEEAEESSPPAEKGRSTTEDKRKWKETWVNHEDVPDGQLWAYWCDETNSIKCKCCVLYGKTTALSNPDGTGSKRVRLDTLKTHAINEDHKDALFMLKKSRARPTCPVHVPSNCAACARAMPAVSSDALYVLT